MIKVDENAILNAEKPGDIFSNDATKIKEEYRNLCKIWHPDTNKSKKAAEVFAKINELYTLGVGMIAHGDWEMSNAIVIKREDGRRFQLTYLSIKTFEIGIAYIGRTILAYKIDGQHKRYFDNAIEQMKFTYANYAMGTQFSRILPKIKDNFKDINGDFWIILHKSSDVYCLEDVFEYYNRKIPDRHVAWIVSRLCNIACYLQCSGVAHNGICLRNCYISPEYHQILLLGGWWYATKIGSNMIGTVREVYDIMPPSIKSSKQANIKTDLESVKALARTLLGSKSGMGFVKDIQIPKPFVTFITDSSTGDAKKEFELWDHTLEASYGERKFIPMELSEEDIYHK